MELRSAPEMRIVDWAAMGMWRKNCFSLLMGLAARLPDFKFIAFMDNSEGEIEFALVVDLDGDLHHAVAEGASKNKAKNKAAEALVASAKIHAWLAEHHADTLCGDHLLE